jgi:hypothetical protein
VGDFFPVVMLGAGKMNACRFLQSVVVIGLGIGSLTQNAQADNYGNAILNDAPAGYWRLNETGGNSAADASGGGNPAIYQSDQTTYAIGQGGFLPFAGNAAVHFNGGSVYGPYNADSAILSQNYSPALQPFAYANTFTIEAWVRDNSPLPVNELDPNFGSRMIFAGNYGFGLTEINEPHFVTYGRKDYILSSVHVSQNQWHQMAVSYTGLDATFYVDGVNVGVVSVVHGGDSAQTSSQFGIGRRVTAEAPWLGDIDEVAIYNSILTDEQILNHYQAALSEFGDADGDGQIGFSDLVAVAQHYGNETSSFKSGDFDSDGLVSFADLVTVAQHYGQVIVPEAPAAPGAEVPEPATGALLAGAAMVLLRRQRRAAGRR